MQKPTSSVLDNFHEKTARVFLGVVYFTATNSKRWGTGWLVL